MPDKPEEKQDLKDGVKADTAALEDAVNADAAALQGGYYEVVDPEESDTVQIPGKTTREREETAQEELDRKKGAQEKATPGKVLTHVATTLDMEEIDRQLKYAELELVKREKFLDMLRKRVLRSLRPGDVIDFGGHPHFVGFGSERIRTLTGISILEPKMSDPIYGEDERGKWFMFYCYGKAYHPVLGDVEVIGIANSREDFYRKRKTKEGKDIYLPAEEVSMADVAGKAYTAMIRNAIVRSLALRGATMGDLKAFGLDISRVKRVSFKKGKQSS